MDVEFYYDQLKEKTFTGKYIGKEGPRAVIEVNSQGNDDIKTIFQQIRSVVGQVNSPFNSINFVNCRK